MARGKAITMQDVANVVAARVLDPIASKNTIGALVGRDHSTVARIEERYKGLIAQYAPLQTRKLLDDLDITRRAYLSRLLDPDVLDSASARDTAVVFGIVSDKHALQAGMPTSITLNANLDVAMPHVLERLQRAIQARSGQAGQAGQAGEAGEATTTSSGESEQDGPAG